MMQNENITPARERKLVRGRAEQIQRALAGIELMIDGLSPVDQLIALNEALSEKLRMARKLGVIAVEP